MALSIYKKATTTFIKDGLILVGTVNYPGVDPEKPYHAAACDNSIKLSEPIEKHIQAIKEESFKTEEEAIQHILKKNGYIKEAL